MALGPVHVGKIHGCQNLKAVVHRSVLVLNGSRKALHVGLAKAQEDVEIRVRVSQGVGAEREQYRQQ